MLRPLIECWRKEAFILDYDKCYVWNSTCHFSFFCHLISNLFYVIFCKNCLIRLLCNHVSCVLPFHYQMYVFGDKLIIFINTNHLSIAHICTKNILAYSVLCLRMSYTINSRCNRRKKKILYERLTDPFNNRIYRLLNILVSITGLAYTPTIVYSSHLLTKTGIQTVSIQILRDLLHFLQK